MRKVEFKAKTGYTKKLKYTFYYRFNCQRCHETIEWLPFELYGEGVVAVKGIAAELDKKSDNSLTKKAKAHINAEIEEIKEEIANNDFRRFNSRCPYCGKKQFWAAPPKKTYTYIYGTFIAFMWCILIVLMGSMGWLLNTLPNMILMGMGIITIFYDTHVYLLVKGANFNKKMSRFKDVVEFNWEGECEEVFENMEAYI